LGGRVAQRHQLALLARLATARHRTLSRDKLLGYLWPEADNNRARHRLNVAVHKVRRALGEDAIVSLVDDLRLNTDVVASDVAEFEAAVRAGKLERAVEVYGGAFLDGFHLKGAREFDAWASQERERLAGRYAEALRQLAGEAGARGDGVSAVRWWRMLVAHGPYQAPAVCGLMEALMAGGDRAGALEAGGAYARRVKLDLEMEPDLQVVALLERVRCETPELVDGSTAVVRGRSGSAISPEFTDSRVQGRDQATASGPGTHARQLWSGALRNRWIVMAGIAGAIAVVVVGTRLWVHQSRVLWARNVALPEAAQLMDEGRTYAAFRLLREAEAYAPDDPILAELLIESTTPVTVRTTPPGAQVYARDFFDEPNAWELLGSTPLEELRLPSGLIVWRISLEGFETKVGLAFTPERTLHVSLQPVDEAAPDMVHVPGGNYEFFTREAELDDFWIDKYEVTNRQFKAFVDRGGYDRREFWPEFIVKDGVVLGWDETRRLVLDRTGWPGPATWEVGAYAEGQDEYPVGGVSWYEASAFCASVGKQLPTAFHWYHAAALFSVTELAQFSNFATDGPTTVGHPLRLGLHGTFDMAGNVKEWVWNEADTTRRYILGGGWSEPSYQFHVPDAQDPWDREPMYGFRCAKYPAHVSAAQTAPIAKPFRDYRQETPVGDEMFAVYRRLYEYDRMPLEPQVDPVREEFEHWAVEHVSFAAAYGNERVPAQLFLPKNARPPFQTVVYFPGAAPFFQRSSPEGPFGDAYWFLFLVRSGRAVVLPVYKGMYERHVGFILLPHIWRDMVIHAAKDLRRAVDYLETRPDIATQKLAYFGISSGAGVGPIMTAVEPRFQASILLGGGLYFWQRPPESESFHFAPRVKVPTLMVNGRHDFYHQWETSQVPMYEWLGTPPADKRHRLFESGHVPTERQEVIKEVLDWLDRYLGPVTRR
jgi:DNA-binding SARP family transcriptional activator